MNLSLGDALRFHQVAQQFGVRGSQPQSAFHVPLSYSSWVSTARTKTLWVK